MQIPEQQKAEDIDPTLIKMRERITRTHGLHPPYHPL